MSEIYDTIVNLLDGFNVDQLENLKDLIDEKKAELMIKNLPDNCAFIGKTKHGHETFLPVSLTLTRLCYDDATKKSFFELYDELCIDLIVKLRKLGMTVDISTVPERGLSCDQDIEEDDLWEYVGDEGAVSTMDRAIMCGFNIVTTAHLEVERTGIYTPGVYVDVSNDNILILLLEVDGVIREYYECDYSDNTLIIGEIMFDLGNSEIFNPNDVYSDCVKLMDYFPSRQKSAMTSK